MSQYSRRGFMADIGRGMLVASVGSTMAFDLGLSKTVAAEAGPRLTFAGMEPLVTLLQETPAENLTQRTPGETSSALAIIVTRSRV